MSLFSFFGDRSAKSNSQADSLPPASQVFDNATFSSSSSPSSSSSSSSSFSQPAPTAAESLFSTSTYDPAKLHPMAGLGGERQLEYLTLEEDKTNLEGGALMGNRGFSDDVITGTGAAYVTGLGLGGVMGGLKGLRDPRPMSTKLRWNAILNGGGTRASYYANSAGVLAIYYNVANNIVAKVRPDGVMDVWGSMGAAALSGAVWNWSAGPRPRAAAAGIAALGAAGWSYGKEWWAS